MALASTANAQTPWLNEIYLSHTGDDDQEFIELVGPPGFSLQGWMVLVVEGEGAAAGTLDRAWDLTGLVVPSSSFFVLGDTAVVPKELDIGSSNVLENGTETFYLVQAADPSAILALLGTDVSTGPFTTRIPSLSSVEDALGVIDADWPALDTVFDFPTIVGPDGSSFPAGVYRGGDFPAPWCSTSFLDFDDVANADQPRTPGASNGACIPAGAPVLFGGSLHTALGQAGVSTGGGHLTISNIGSSGLDGVSIDIGESAAFVTRMMLRSELWQQGDTMQTMFIATGGPVGTAGLRRSPNGYEALVDFAPLGSPTYTAILFDDGDFVTSASGLSGPAVELRFFGEVAIECDCSIDAWQWSVDIDVEFEIGASLFTGDQIVFEPDFPQAAGGGLVRAELTAQGVSALSIESEALRLFGFDHTAVGTAELETSMSGSHRITISNLGSSVLDGVSIDLGVFDQGFGIELEPLDLFGTVGGAVGVRAFGTFAATAGTDLGSAQLVNNGGVVEATADYASLGATVVRVEVYDGGALVSSAVVPGVAVVATVTAHMAGSPGLEGCGKLSPDPPCFFFEWSAPVSITPAGGPGPFVGDELRLVAVDAVGSVESLERFDALFGTFAQASITGEFAIATSISCVDITDGSNGTAGVYCASSATSNGISDISSSALVVSMSAPSPQFVLTADNLPILGLNCSLGTQPGIFISGPGQSATPFFNGTLCIAPGGLQRLRPVLFPDPVTATVSLAVDLATQAQTLTGGAAPLNVVAGSRYNFQYWTRDPCASVQGAPSGANFSSAIGICFHP